jgi:hypothetical protein
MNIEHSDCFGTSPLCCWVGRSRDIEGSWCLNFQGQAVIFLGLADPENKGTTILSVGNTAVRNSNYLESCGIYNAHQHTVHYRKYSSH